MAKANNKKQESRLLAFPMAPKNPSATLTQ